MVILNLVKLAMDINLQNIQDSWNTLGDNWMISDLDYTDKGRNCTSMVDVHNNIEDKTH